MPWEMGLRWWIFALSGVLEVVDGQEKREKKGTERRGGSSVNIYVCRQSRTTVPLHRLRWKVIDEVNLSDSRFPQQDNLRP